ncbi:RING finger protein 17-like isoform X2 [Acanthaster planci]|uniref:RING finger protein 17-like isoform X2 n=1 Tax=Acanthaster planci TaxID=133434 RepID=A0A8B7XLN0_ACAPL|nr:RING finger protein 17-like isoform X2 [Acanthaster planci]
MEEAREGGQTCPHCFRSFRGAQGPAHERFLQPLLLRCGHTFCQGCISKQVKVLKTSIACPTCQVVTSMPLGEASIKQLPANYYMLGYATWNTKQVMDMFDQKVEFQPSSKLEYKGVQLEGGKELCTGCHRIIATCQCQQCGDIYCAPCFARLHRGSRALQTHPSIPLSTPRSEEGCKEHERREFEFFCKEDKVPICALCALMGNHKGHDIIQLSDQDKESLKELKPACDMAKEVLKHQYYARQMAKDTKRDIHKELNDVADGVKASFAHLHAVLQLREHALVEQIVGVASQQTQYIGAMLTNIEGNISILESAIIDALIGLGDDAVIPANITKLVHTLQSSQALPNHIVIPKSEQQQPLSCFTYSSDTVSSLMTFGAVKICSEPRLELKTESDLPDDWEAPVINDDILNNSAIHNYKKQKEQNKALSPSGKSQNAAVPTKVGETTPTGKVKESRLVRSHLSPRGSNVLGRELVRVTHIRNPCCFYIQRESDQSQLSNMMVRINKDCKSFKESNRLPDNLSAGAMLCCLYEADKTWYRVRIKSITYPDPEVISPIPTPPQSPKQTPTETQGETATGTEGANENYLEVGSEVGSETSQDIVFEVKPTVKPDGKLDVKPKVKVNKSKVEVIYVDYGNSETVPLSSLCRLKSKHHSIPDLAVCCSLTDIVPTRKSGRWSLEAVHSFANMVGDKPVYMSILGHSGATLYVDLHKPPLLEVEDDMPISLRDALVFLELACFVSPESVPEAAPSRGPPLKFIAADLPVQGEEILVTVSHFQDPECFCVQEIGEDCEYLLKMMKDLQEFYNRPLDDRWNILCPKKGTICVAHFSEDNQWSRAEIVDLPGSQQVDVLYVDYGNYERVHCSKLRKISKKFLKLCMQALPCSLADIGPKDPEKGWTAEENDGFGTIVLTKALRATVKGIQKRRLSIILVEDRQDREININALLVQKGFAQSTGPGSVSAAIIFDIPHSDFSDDDTLKNEGTPSTDSGTDTQASIPKTNGAARPYTITSPSKSQPSSKLSSQAPSSQYTSVHISHVESPACIYIQLSTARKDGLDSLLETMTLTYKQLESTEDIVWQEGDSCSALLIREGVWCRGRIKTVLPDENAIILFTDYGNTEVVSFSNIRPLLAKFQDDPPFAIQCHLADVIPGGDKQKWTRTACEFLAATLSDLECVIVKKGDLQNGSLPIDLLYERSIEEKLEQQTTEDFGSISKLLLLKGLALPVRRVPARSSTSPPSDQQLPTKSSSPHKPSDSSVGGPTSKSQDKPSQHASAGSSPGVSPQLTVSQFESAEEEGDFPRYLLPPLPTSGRLDLVITYVSTDGIISGLEASEVDTFRDVMERLQAANSISQPVPMSKDLREGQAVCAQFQEDGLWYRARITRVHADAAEVHYVDFGNSETVPFPSIHLKPFKLDMPQQSRDCILIGLRPKPPSSSWPVTTIQFLLETLVEQSCTALIKSLCKKGEPLKVDLLLPTGQSINMVLVAEGLAENEDNDDGSEKSCPFSEVEASRDVATLTPNGRVVSPEMGVAIAGLEVEYKPMRLPAKGSQLAVSVTHINQPDMVYIQPWADHHFGDGPVQLETYHQLAELQRMSADLNKMAPTLPSVTNPQIGLCCCALYQVNQQWFRTTIHQVKSTEKLCEVQFVDYGTTEWVPFEGLRQIPEKFTTLPMQARQCQLIGLKPPSPSAAYEGATLPDSDWPMASVDKLLELVSNKKLIASIQNERPVPGIFLYEADEVANQSMMSLRQVGCPIHQALIEAGLAQLNQPFPSEADIHE